MQHCPLANLSLSLHMGYFMLPKRKKFNKIPEKIFSTALSCSTDLIKFLQPKIDELVLFEMIVYITSRIDLSMVRYHLNDMLRSELLEYVWMTVDSNFSGIVKEISITDAINDRLDQYGSIYRTSSGTEVWRKLHDILRQLLFHAAQNDHIFKWRMGHDPLLLGLLEGLELQTLLTELETKRIIPFEADCNRIFKSVT